MENEKGRKYTNDEITVVWKPSICSHSGKCVKGLSSVFDSKKQPWIKMDGATTTQIIEQVNKCPSGALSFHYNNVVDAELKDQVIEPLVLEFTHNGPILIKGKIKIKDSLGNITEKDGTSAFCRCGGSSNKPFCDGTHRKNDFQT